MGEVAGVAVGEDEDSLSFAGDFLFVGVHFRGATMAEVNVGNAIPEFWWIEEVEFVFDAGSVWSPGDIVESRGHKEGGTGRIFEAGRGCGTRAVGELAVIIALVHVAADDSPVVADTKVIAEPRLGGEGGVFAEFAFDVRRDQPFG